MSQRETVGEHLGGLRRLSPLLTNREGLFSLTAVKTDRKRNISSTPESCMKQNVRERQKHLIEIYRGRK